MRRSRSYPSVSGARRAASGDLGLRWRAMRSNNPDMKEGLLRGCSHSDRRSPLCLAHKLRFVSPFQRKNAVTPADAGATATGNLRKVVLRAARGELVHETLEVVGVQDRRVGAVVAVGVGVARGELVQETLEV